MDQYFSASIAWFKHSGFFYGLPKGKVDEKNVYHSIGDMKEVIINAVNEITPDILRNAYKEL